MTEGAIVLSILFSVLGVMLLIFLLVYGRQQRENATTQRQLSDRDLLRLMWSQPDRLLSPHQLRDQAGLSLSVARSRLSALMTYGILHRHTNRHGRFFYGMRAPLVEPPALNLSSDPFLTVEDLLEIFAAYDYRITPQELILATGLPLAIIKREMKYFEQRGIVQRLQRSAGSGTLMVRFFVLQEPYRSDPEKFRQQAGTLNLQMRELLRNDNLLV